MSISVADLFCGTGGFSHGFMQTGSFDVVLGVEIRKASIDTFAANHKQALAICDDIRNVRLKDVAERLGKGNRSIDVIIGGPPCQGFSSIRPFRSINEDDRRNTLFEQFTLFVDFFRPKFVVFENVVGLKNHKEGKVLAQIESAIQELGYATSVGVLNAMNYGVPQKRERVIVIAREGKPKPRLPAPTHAGNGRVAAKPVTKAERRLFDNELPPAITVGEAIGDLPPVAAGESATFYPDDVPASVYAKARRKGKCRLELHSSTRHTDRMLEIIRLAGKNRWALPEGLTTSGFSSCYSRLDADEPSTTITVNFVHPASNRCIHPTQDRALTPREGARIQSYDDDFVFCGFSDANRQANWRGRPALARKGHRPGGLGTMVKFRRRASPSDTCSSP